MDLSAFYPSMTGNAAPATESAAPADPLAALYPSAVQPEPSVPPSPSEPEFAAEQALANKLYDLPTNDGVNYLEPVPTSAQTIPIDLPEEVASTTTPAEIGQIKEAFVEAGVGLTLAGSLVKQAAAAVKAPITTTPEQAEAALRQKFGSGADAKIAAARGMIEQAAQRWPGVWDFLDRSGLGNSPHLIEQLAARAARRTRT